MAFCRSGDALTMAEFNPLKMERLMQTVYKRNMYQKEFVGITSMLLLFMIKSNCYDLSPYALPMQEYPPKGISINAGKYCNGEAIVMATVAYKEAAGCSLLAIFHAL